MSIAYIVLAIFIVFTWAYFFGGNVPRAYRQRKCMGRKWKSVFPQSPKTEIREFLLMFAEAFCFQPEHKLKFEPEDKICDIYRAIYPSKSAPDVLEVETFSLLLEQEYGFDLAHVWSETLSLGEVYRAIKNA